MYKIIAFLNTGIADMCEWKTIEVFVLVGGELVVGWEEIGSRFIKINDAFNWLTVNAQYYSDDLRLAVVKHEK